MHQSITDLLEHFEYGHLQQPLVDVSAPFCELARRVAATLEGPEAIVALRKLLESKDAAVRAKVVMMKRGAA